MVVELPQEIVDKIVDEIALEGSRETRDQTRDMKSFSLVSSKWSRRSRSHLFRSLEITSNSFLAWCSDVRPGNDGPSRHITSIRYKPWCSEAERSTGPSESLARSPSHMSAFTCLRTLHFVEISLQHPGYLACFGVLTKVVRELWLEDCQMDITQFVSLVRPFTNLDWLRLIRPRCASESKLQHWDMAEPPILKGALDFHQPANAENIASFTQELSLLPAYFSTIAFREHLETPTEANRLLAGSRRTLTKLTLSHNTIPKGINLSSLYVLKELELSTFVVRVLPSVLRSVKSKHLKSIRFFLLIHHLEGDVEYSTRQSWTKFDFELCALADRVQAANTYNSGELKVNFVPSDPTTPVWMVEEVAGKYLPRSKEHGYIDSSFSVG